jgi:hypothetical protein
MSANRKSVNSWAHSATANPQFVHTNLQMVEPEISWVCQLDRVDETPHLKSLTVSWQNQLRHHFLFELQHFKPISIKIENMYLRICRCCKYAKNRFTNRKIRKSQEMIGSQSRKSANWRIRRRSANLRNELEREGTSNRQTIAAYCIL